VTLRLYDTATRRVRDFVPLTPGRVGIYLCGLTVQSIPHIGHLRSGVNYDVLRRWLLHSGYEVRFIRNITDIDDKVIEKSVQQDRPFWAIAYANEQVLAGPLPCAERAGRRRTSRWPRPHPEMHELIDMLLAAGHAYVSAAENGDVYFDVPSYPEYGALSGLHADDIAATDRRGEPDKRDFRDFALWKGAKPDEPADASWSSPWGRGRPGWHIECSAMARRYLGAEFDIHGGGLDLMFPHHENEIAQSGRPACRSPATGCTRAAQPRRGQDEQVAGQRHRPGRGRGDGHPARWNCGTTWQRRTTGPGSTTPTRRCVRRPSRTGGSRASCSARPRSWARSGRRPCRPRSRRRWTTT
jgi:cysteinyl-tRNA synthetase